MKTCTKCFTEKQDDEFYIQKSWGRSGSYRSAYCKICVCKDRKEFREKNGDLIRERTRKYNIANREKRSKHKRERRQFLQKTEPGEIARRDKKRWLRYEYGLTVEQYDGMRKAQGESCAICRKPFVNGGRKTNFGVDHCHKTGEVRGLLCYHCNSGLAMAQENVEILNGMIAYLQRYNGA